MTAPWSSFDATDDEFVFDDEDPGDTFQDIPSMVPTTSSTFSSTSLPTAISGVIVHPETDERRQHLLVQAFEDGQTSDQATLDKESPFTVGNLSSSKPVRPHYTRDVIFRATSFQAGPIMRNIFHVSCCTFATASIPYMTYILVCPSR